MMQISIFMLISCTLLFTSQ